MGRGRRKEQGAGGRSQGAQGTLEGWLCSPPWLWGVQGVHVCVRTCTLCNKLSIPQQSCEGVFRKSGLLAHRFELLPVQLAPVQQDRVDGVARPGGLDVRGQHVQKILKRNACQRGACSQGQTGGGGHTAEPPTLQSPPT